MSDKNDETLPMEEIPTVKGELVEPEAEEELNLDDFFPSTNSSVPDMPKAEPTPPLITGEAVKDIYEEILGMLRNEHTQVTDYIDNFAEMVINGGDPSTSSKEALVGLINIRTAIPDKMTKIADLMTRVIMKQPDTYKPYLGNQTTNVVIGDTSGERRTLLETIKKAKKKDKKK